MTGDLLRNVPEFLWILKNTFLLQEGSDYNITK